MRTTYVAQYQRHGLHGKTVDWDAGVALVLDTERCSE